MTTITAITEIIARRQKDAEVTRAVRRNMLRAIAERGRTVEDVAAAARVPVEILIGVRELYAIHVGLVAPALGRWDLVAGA